MVFKHDNFQLDQDEQIVFDGSGNELRIFGNEYLMLEQLCKKEASSGKQLAVLFGLGEFYKGGALDKYMNRLNAHLRVQVVKKEDDEYSIVGAIEKTDKVERAEVQGESVVQEDKENKVFKKLQISWQMILTIIVGMAVGFWLLKYILAMLF